MEATPWMLDHALASRAAAAAACVLLKNIDGTLPLLPLDDAPVRVAVFGAGQIVTAFAGEGMEPWRTVNLLDGLCAAKELAVDPLLRHKYRTWALEHPDGQQMPVRSFSMEEYASQNDAAIVVITRAPASRDFTLTDEEKALLDAVCAAFSRTVLVLNTAGFVELSDEALRCKAIVLLGVAGQEAGFALADVLTAKVVPSGHLAHTWPMRLEDYDEACAQADGFVGYRYFDSFDVPVRYPFGYGLGYGKSELGEVSVALDGSDVIVSACVENTGTTYPVQELVQVYVSHDGAADEPVYRLLCFQKSALLQPGEKQTLRLSFPLTELARFHEDACAYVLEEGYYDIRVGTNCRNSVIAGSLRALRSAVVQAVSPLPMEKVPARSRKGVSPFTYPAEKEELEAARSHAIRLSDRNLPRKSRKKGRAFSGCRSDGTPYTLDDVRAGRCNLFQFVACMDDHSLRELVYGFAEKEPSIDGALGASCALERYAVPAVTLAAGAGGLHLTKDLPQNEDEPARHRYCTAFPMASTLACAFDPGLVRAVGRAIGQEMRQHGVELVLAPGASVQRTPKDADFAERWSEDPVLCGLCARAIAEGMKPFGAAVLCSSDFDAPISQTALREVYGLGFEIAAGAYDAWLLPNRTLAGEPVCEDSALVRALLVDWRYGGMFLTEGERYLAEPTRVTLEKSALRMLKLILDTTK